MRVREGGEKMRERERDSKSESERKRETSNGETVNGMHWRGRDLPTLTASRKPSRKRKRWAYSSRLSCTRRICHGAPFFRLLRVQGDSTTAALGDSGSNWLVGRCSTTQSVRKVFEKGAGKGGYCRL